VFVLSVGRSVCPSVGPAVMTVYFGKMENWIQMPFGVHGGSGGPNERCIRWGPDPLRELAHSWKKIGRRNAAYRENAVKYNYTAINDQ